MRRFWRYWDLLSNSGNFRDTLPMLWEDGASAFGRFMALSDRLYARWGGIMGSRCRIWRSSCLGI